MMRFSRKNIVLFLILCFVWTPSGVQSTQRLQTAVQGAKTSPDLKKIEAFKRLCTVGDVTKINKFLDDVKHKNFPSENPVAIGAGLIVAIKSDRFKDKFAVVKALVERYEKDSENFFPNPILQDALIICTTNTDIKTLDFLLEKFQARKVFLPASRRLFKAIERLKVGFDVPPAGIVLSAFDFVTRQNIINKVWAKIEKLTGGDIKRADFECFPLKIWAANILLQVAAENKNITMIDYLTKDESKSKFDINRRDVENTYAIIAILKAVNTGSIDSVKKLMEIYGRDMGFFGRLFLGTNYVQSDSLFIVDVGSGISLEYLDIPEDLFDLFYDKKTPKKLLSEILKDTNPKGQYTLRKFCVNEGLFVAGEKGHLKIVEYFLDNFADQIEDLDKKIKEREERLEKPLKEFRKGARAFDEEFKAMKKTEKLKFLYRLEDRFKKTKGMGLAILIDKGQEVPEKISEALAVTSELADFLKEKMCILASSSLLYNLLCRVVYKNNPDKFLIAVEDQAKWKDRNQLMLGSFDLKNLEKFNLYVVLGTQFIFFVPKGIDQVQVKKYFDIDGFENITEKITKIIDPESSSQVDIKYFKDIDKPAITNIDQFRAVFKKNIFKRVEHLKKEKESKKEVETQEPEASLVVYMSGHGGVDTSIASLPIIVMQGLLNFFKEYVSFLFVSTCYGGGRNIAKVVKSLPYTVVVQGIEDVSVTGVGPITKILNDLIAGKEISEVFRQYAELPSFENELHAQINIPQILYPLTNCFVPLNFSDRIASISSVLSWAHVFEIDSKKKCEARINLWAPSDDEKTTLRKGETHLRLKKDPLIVLVYPEKITAEVSVRLLNMNNLQDPNFKIIDWERDKKGQWKDFPVALDLALEKKSEYFSGNSPDLCESCKNLVFPAFIPMAKRNILSGEIRQIFDHVNVVNSFYDEQNNKVIENVPYVGVFKFIRDAFFDIDQSQRSMKIITIKKLEGANDMSLLLKLRGSGGFSWQKCELLQALIDPAHKKPVENITLKNVVIRAGYDKTSEKIVRQLGFCIGDKYLCVEGPLTVTGDDRWYTKELFEIYRQAGFDGDGEGFEGAIDWVKNKGLSHIKGFCDVFTQDNKEMMEKLNVKKLINEIKNKVMACPNSPDKAYILAHFFALGEWPNEVTEFLKTAFSDEIMWFFESLVKENEGNKDIKNKANVKKRIEEIKKDVFKGYKKDIAKYTFLRWSLPLGVFFDDAHRLASVFMRSNSSKQWSWGLWLFFGLVREGQFFEDAIRAAQWVLRNGGDRTPADFIYNELEEKRDKMRKRGEPGAEELEKLLQKYPKPGDQKKK